MYKGNVIKVLLIAFMIYGIVLYGSKTLLRVDTINDEIKDKKNINELGKDLKSLGEKANIESTTHFYYEELSENIKKKIDKINDEIQEKLGSEYTSIPEINEVYYSAKKTSNSDLSFIRLHTDSPFHFSQTYRVLICIEPNENVRTIIPGDEINTSLKKYEVLGFDYANTLHYITIDEGNMTRNRIILKLHYGKSEISKELTMKYTKWARELYVNNLNSIGIMGYGMLITQYLGTNLGSIVLTYSILVALYLSRTKGNETLMYTLLIVGGSLTLYNILFQLYFFWN